MPELTITIPDEKLVEVLEAFAARRGIEPTLEAVRREFVEEIKTVVWRYRQSQVPREEL